MRCPCFSRISSASITARGTNRHAGAPPGGEDFRIAVRHRGRDDDRIGSCDVFRGVSERNAGGPSCVSRRVAALVAMSDPLTL